MSSPVPQLYVKVGNTYQMLHQVPGGQVPQAPESRAPAVQMDPRRLPLNVLQELASGKFVTVPAWYTVSMTLGGEPGNANAGATPLRPERFFLYRVTCATNGDAPPYQNAPFGYSTQMRAVEVSWADEFTRFFGEQPCLAAALFGDSQGFLDMVQPILFQGRQTLSVRVRRVNWPSEEDAAATRWDFNFQGLGILPVGNQVSGGL
jgi:hypothetical protein